MKTFSRLRSPVLVAGALLSIAFASATAQPDRALLTPEESELAEVMSSGAHHALLIAVQNYLHDSVNDLDHPIAEAESLQEVLVSQYEFEPENVALLSDPGRDAILGTLENLESELGPNDSLLVFFAGHGFYRENIKQGYWLPADSKRRPRANWISNSDIRDAIAGIKTRHTLLISDACFSGGIFKERNAFDDADKATRELYRTPSRKAMTSGTLKTVPDRSAFLNYLKRRLEENQNRFLTADQLFSSFRTAVINNTPNANKPQYGVIQQAGDEGGEFVFVRRSEGGERVTRTEAAGPASEDGAATTEAERTVVPPGPPLEIDLASLGPGRHRYPGRQVTLTGELILDGSPFELETERLVAQDAYIASLRLVHGRDGQTGTRGADGSPAANPAAGADGPSGRKGGPGGPGGTGTDAGTVTLIAREFAGKIRVRAQGRKGGNGGVGGAGGNGADGTPGAAAEANAFACLQAAGGGGNGGDAGDGGPGGAGGRGGNAAKVVLQFETVEPGSSISVDATGGDAGASGRGGSPGRPGKGGPGGSKKGLCREDGPSGKPGREGTIGTVFGREPAEQGTPAEIEVVIGTQREVFSGAFSRAWIEQVP